MIPSMAQQLSGLQCALSAKVDPGPHVSQRQRGEDNRQVVLGIISSGPVTRAALMAQTGLSDTSIDHHCKILVKRGLIKRMSARPMVWTILAH